jgi:hypothetical protein
MIGSSIAKKKEIMQLDVYKLNFEIVHEIKYRRYFVRGRYLGPVNIQNHGGNMAVKKRKTTSKKKKTVKKKSSVKKSTAKKKCAAKKSACKSCKKSMKSCVCGEMGTGGR